MIYFRVMHKTTVEVVRDKRGLNIRFFRNIPVLCDKESLFYEYSALLHAKVITRVRAVYSKDEVIFDPTVDALGGEVRELSNHFAGNAYISPAAASFYLGVRLDADREIMEFAVRHLLAKQNDADQTATLLAYATFLVVRDMNESPADDLAELVNRVTISSHTKIMLMGLLRRTVV